MKGRALVLVVGLSGLAVLTWYLVPSPFIRGAVVGAVTAGVAAITAMIIFTKIMQDRVGNRLEPPPLPREKWDYDSDFRTLDGELLTGEELRGSVIVLNFWATWCAPCIAEMPSMARLAERTSELPVRVLCVSEEAPDVVKKFAAKNELGVPLYTLSEDRPSCFEGRAIPATFVLDKTGVIQLRHFGAAKWDDESVVDFVRGLAVQPAN